MDLPRGLHVTNCLQCNVTCHENCAIADDAEKRGCAAMTDVQYALEDVYGQSIKLRRTYLGIQ